MSSITLKTNERVFTTGKTGSGKTYLSHYLTAGCSRLLVLDGKGTLSDWNLSDWDDESIKALREGEPVRARVVAPFGVKTAEFWDTIMYEIYLAGNCTVYIDELYTLAPPQKPISDLLWALYTRGRELGIGVWASTQRPAWIPLFAMSEAEHFFVFRLQLDDDRKRMSEFMGTDVLTTARGEHGFYYARAEWDKPEYYEKLEVEHGKTSEQIAVETERIPASEMQELRSGFRGALRRKNRSHRLDLSRVFGS